MQKRKPQYLHSSGEPSAERGRWAARQNCAAERGRAQNCAEELRSRIASPRNRGRGGRGGDRGSRMYSTVGRAAAAAVAWRSSRARRWADAVDRSEGGHARRVEHARGAAPRAAPPAAPLCRRGTAPPAAPPAAGVRRRAPWVVQRHRARREPSPRRTTPTRAFRAGCTEANSPCSRLRRGGSSPRAHTRPACSSSPCPASASAGSSGWRLFCWASSWRTVASAQRLRGDPTRVSRAIASVCNVTVVGTGRAVGLPGARDARVCVSARRVRRGAHVAPPLHDGDDGGAARC